MHTHTLSVYPVPRNCWNCWNPPRHDQDHTRSHIQSNIKPSKWEIWDTRKQVNRLPAGYTHNEYSVKNVDSTCKLYSLCNVPRAKPSLLGTLSDFFWGITLPCPHPSWQWIIIFSVKFISCNSAHCAIGCRENVSVL